MTHSLLLLTAALLSVRMAGGFTMPASQQTALVQKYCAVCHTDAARNGGLTLERFDAAAVDPSLAAMLVSKLQNGAIHAAGLPPPDADTVRALTEALAASGAGATRWTIRRDGAVVTAAIVRAQPATLYRLAIGCSPATREGEMQLTWSPTPKTGTLDVSVDGAPPRSYRVEGAEKMGNGAKGTTAGPAAVKLTPRWPSRTLTIGGLFPGETAAFPFDELDRASRRALSACFARNR